jgi:hypothetical protein
MTPDTQTDAKRLTWLLAALLATMRVGWLWPWLLALGAWMAPSYGQPVLPLWALFALLLGGRAAARWMAAHTPTLRQARLRMALLSPLLLLLLIWWQYGRPLALWDVRWLQLATGSPALWAVEVAPAVIAFFAAAGLWLRGVLDGSALTDHEVISGAFITGSVAFALLLVGSHLAGAPLPDGAQAWLIVFLTAGMAALALAGLERSRDAGGRVASVQPRVSRYWLGSVALVIAGVLGLGLLLGALIAPETVAQAIGLLAPVIDLLARVLLAVLYAAVYVLFLVLSPLIDWLRTLFANLQPPEPLEAFASAQPISPLLVEQAAELDAALVEPFRWGVIVVVIVAAAVIFALALRFFRAPESSDVEETRESILSRTLLDAQLRALWAKLRGQIGAETRPDFLGLAGESPARRQVRARYQAFLATMAARHQPRPPGATPAAYAAQLNDLAGEETASVETLTALYVAVRYGDALPAPEQLAQNEVDWERREA